MFYSKTPNNVYVSYTNKSTSPNVSLKVSPNTGD